MKISIILFSFLISVVITDSNNAKKMNECTELGANCRTTAQQEYDDGNYTMAEYDLFYYNICPNAQLECELRRVSES